MGALGPARPDKLTAQIDEAPLARRRQRAVTNSWSTSRTPWCRWRRFSISDAVGQLQRAGKACRSGQGVQPAFERARAAALEVRATAVELISDLN